MAGPTPEEPTPAPADTPETPESATPPGDTPETPPKPVESEETLAKRRADELTRARRDAERRAEKAEAELAALKRKTEAGARPEPPDMANFLDAEGRVKSAEFKNAQAAYEDKLHTWREAQKPAATPPAPTDAPDEAAQQEAIATFQAGVAALAETHPDALEVIERPVFSPLMRDVVWESEIGPQLAYYLGSHQAEALKIANMLPAQAYRELGKLEAKLAAAGAAPATPAPRTVSGAPEPIAPVTPASPASTKDPDKMTTDEFMAWDRARTVERMKKNPLGV